MTGEPPEAARFEDLFAPPEKPLDVLGPGGWEGVEKALSLSLPQDYKWFIERYGTGCVSTFLWIFNPFSTNENLNLLQQVDSLTKQYRDVREALGKEETPFPIYPEAGGLVPFGISDNGDVFFWLANSEEPSEWAVVVNKTRSSVFEVHRQGMVEFLLGIVTGEKESEVFEPEFIDSGRLFLPVDEIEY